MEYYILSKVIVRMVAELVLSVPYDMQGDGTDGGSTSTIWCHVKCWVIVWMVAALALSVPYVKCWVCLCKIAFARSSFLASELKVYYWYTNGGKTWTKQFVVYI